MMRESQGARRYNTLVMLTYSEAVVDEYGHKSYDDPVDMGEVYASVEQMSAYKTLMTFQQADVVGLSIELREPNIVFNGLRYQGHHVVLDVPAKIERGRILRLNGWYQKDR